MSVNNNFQRVAYGLSDALLAVPSAPIISERAPTARDKAPFGQIWVDKPDQDAFILVSIVADNAVWVNIGGGSGMFNNLTVTDFIHAGGDIVTSSGDIVAQLGNLTVTTGDITATAGNITATAGNIIATAGDVAAGGNIVAGTGMATSTGNIVADVGDVVATLGNVEALAGFNSGATLVATGDLGGTASFTSISNVVDNTQSTGALSIVSASANPGTNTGFLKFYVGTTPVFVPYFVTIAP